MRYLFQVAIKVIDIREIKEKYVVKNLHREARIMSALNHPCIVTLFQTIQVGVNVDTVRGVALLLSRRWNR